MEQAYLQTQDLVVGYGDTPLIRDICFEIKRGEILTLIGPNGAGKSTILKSISKQLKVMGGNVMIASKELGSYGYKELATKMSLMLTERVKPELMTTHDIVATGRYPYTGRFGVLSEEDEDKVEEAMGMVQIVDLGHRYYNSLSDGQKQRVLLARALCQEPEVMILDEPTSFLDIKYKLELLSILRTMAKEQNIAVVLSLHEIDLAAKVSDKIMGVKGDTIAHYGEPDEIFHEDIIKDLYEIDKGSFDPCFGSIELQKAEGNPHVFVVSSGGSGIRVFRNLQKANIPFAAGILYENDIDYRLARLLASRVITEKAFCEISDATYNQALKTLAQCEYVIDAGVPLGQCNQKIAHLLEEAKFSLALPVYTLETYKELVR